MGCSGLEKRLRRGLARGLAISGLLVLTGCETIIDKTMKLAMAPIELLATGNVESTLGSMHTNTLFLNLNDSSSSSGPSSSQPQEERTEAYLARKDHLDLAGRKITNAYYEKYGRKCPDEVIKETMAQLNPPVYHYDSIYQIVNPAQQYQSNSDSSDGWQIASFLLGLLPLGQNVTPQQAFLFDTASGAAGRQAVIEGQKEAAGIVREGMQPQQQPYVRQNIIPRGERGVFIVNRGSVQAIMAVCDKPWEDIDRNGALSINEISINPYIPKNDKVYIFGAGASQLGGGQVLHKIINSRGEVMFAHETDSSTLDARGKSENAGDYRVVWYFADGRILGTVPFRITE